MIVLKTDQDVETYVDRKVKEWLDERDRVMSKGGVFMLDVRRVLTALRFQFIVGNL